MAIADLAEVVQAVHAPGLFTDPAQGGHENRHQQGDNRNHHQKLNQRERLVPVFHAAPPAKHTIALVYGQYSMSGRRVE